VRDPDTVPAAVAHAAARFPNAPAVVDPVSGVRRSFAELRERAHAVAGMFVGAGVSPGDRVAICSPNTHHWVEAALGALCAGAVVVPVNTRYTATETLDIVTRSKATALVVCGPFLGVDRLAALRAEGLDLPLVLRVPVDLPPTEDGVTSSEDGVTSSEEGVTSEDGVTEWADIDRLALAVPSAEVDARAAAVGPDDVADILFTSGTTGRSKGAVSAHRQSIAVARAWAQCGGLHTGDRYLVVNPFFHSFGYKAGILACLLSGSTIVPQRVFDAATTVDIIERERITVLPGPPTVYQSLLDHPDRERRDLSGLRLAVTGAATVPVALVERMRSSLTFDTVLTGYGLTEAVVATMCLPDDDAVTVATTCGKATADFELRVTDANGAALPPGQAGEVRLRGPNVMLGYLDDPAATAAAVDADGWLHTGDIGTVDERGYLRITDRLKDMYICGGFNVYPAEVEQALARLPGVAESAVVGIPDHRLGEVGLAYVVPSPGHTLSTSDVIGFCRARLANFKVPRLVEFRTELPRNAGGKVLKHVLRAQAPQGSRTP
jgi:acyl-CoA synthetase (AMP-forming)/AMP-acid ligase II